MKVLAFAVFATDPARADGHRALRIEGDPLGVLDQARKAWECGAVHVEVETGGSRWEWFATACAYQDPSCVAGSKCSRCTDS